MSITNKSILFYLTGLALFYIVNNGCSTITNTKKQNNISYSFLPYDSTIKIGDDYYFRNDFINYDNYIFEFLLKLKCETTVYTSNMQNPETTCIDDTIGVFVYDLSLKKYHSIWPFDSTFIIIEKNKLPAQKEKGFTFHITKVENQDSVNQDRSKIDFKHELVYGKKLAYYFQEDSLAEKKLFYIDKKELNSPYEFFSSTPKNYNYSIIGYNFRGKKEHIIFGSVIKNIVPISDSTKELCAKIILAIKKV